MICDFSIFVSDFFVFSKRVYEEKISDLPLEFSCILLYSVSIAISTTLLVKV